MTMKRSVFSLLLTACVSVYLPISASADEVVAKETDVMVVIDGEEVKTTYVSGGEPLGEGRRTASGSIVYSDVSHLTLRFSSEDEYIKRVLERLEKAIADRKGPVIEVTKQGRAGKVKQTYTGARDGSVKIGKTATGSEQVTLKPIRLEING